MNKYRKRGFAAIALCLLMGTSLLGCGNGTPKIGKVEQSGIYLTKEGNATVFLVETFDKEYYSETELEQMILSEVEVYNSQAQNGEDGAQAVTLTDILSPQEKNESVTEAAADTITVQMEYASSADYTAFNGKMLFFGTVAQAKEAGYLVEADLKSTSGEGVLTKEDAQAMEENHILIFEENIAVQVPYEVLYVSEGITVDGKTVVFEGTDGELATVIMK